MHPRQRGISSTPIVSEQMAHRLRGSEWHVNNIAMTPSPPTITTRRAIHDLWGISTDFLKCIRSSSKSKYLIIFIVVVVVLLHFISAASVVFSSPSEKGTVVAVQKESVDLSPHRAGGDNGGVGRGGERQGGQLHSKELELSYNQKTKDVESLLRSVARVKDLRKTLDKLIAGRQERSTLVSHSGSNKLIPVTVEIKAHVADDGVDRYASQTMQDDNIMTANDKENDQTAVKVSNGRGIHTEKKLLVSIRRSGEETSNEVRRGQETHVTSNNVIAPPPPPPLKLTASPKPLPTTSSDRAEGLAVASMRKCEHFDYHRSSLGGDERRGGPAGVGAETLKKRKKTIMATEEESVRIRRELMKASFHRHISSFEESNGQKSSLLKAERTSRREYDLSKVYWRPVLSDTEHGEDLGIRAADHLRRKGIIKSPLPDALRCLQQMLPQHSILPLERALLECTRKGDEHPFVFPPQPHDPSQPHPHVASLFSPSDAMQRFHCLLSVINKKRLYGTKYFDSYSSHTNPIRNLDGGGGGGDAGGRGGQGGDRPSGASTCADVYGLDLITRLIRAKTTVCEQPDDRVDGKGLATTRGSRLSYIGCNAVIAHPSHDVHTAVCSASNVSISFSRRRSMLDGDYPWLSFQHGALKAHCRNLRNEGDGGWGRRRGRDVHNKLSKPRTMRGHEYFPATELKFMHCLADWMDLGYSAMESGPNAELACASLKAKPTYFLTRSGDFSPFAATHDYLNTLIAFLVEHEALEKNQKPVGLADNDNEKGLDGARHLSPQAVGGGAQIVVMDRMGMGFYAPILQLLFSRADTTVRWLPDLRDDPLHDSACYEKAIFNIPARLSPIYNHDSCGGSILMRLYADLILYVTGAYRVRSPDHTLVMTVIARRDYSATGHTIGRRIGNHEAFVSALREQLDPKPLAAIAGRSSSSSPPADESINIVVNNIDYADFDFDQQVAISRSTDVLVAMHGAGLVQMMFMGGSRGDDLFVFGDSYNNAGVESLSAKSISAPYEPKGMGAGGVFELFCPEKPSSNFRYSQLAMRMGLLYGSYEIGGDDNVVPLHTVVPQIQKLAEDVWRRKVQ